MGCAKWPHGSGEYFYYWGRPSPTLIDRDMGPYVGQNDQKSSKFFVFVYETWGVIEWAHGGDHYWHSDRLVNSAISGSNRADRPRSVGKFSQLPFQLLSFAQGRKNWSPAPQWAACGSWGVGDQFFRPPGPSCQSHSDFKKMRRPSRAPQRTR